MKQKPDVIIQARMNATRLPDKVLLPFMGLTFLEYLVERLKKSKKIGRIIVATTTNPKDDAVEKVCRKRKYLYFRGSENDVLDRFLKAAEKYKSTVVVRVTSDNPFTDIKEMEWLIATLQKNKLDYIGNHQKNMPSGLGSEACTVEALQRAAREAKASDEREHVTPYFYRNLKLFKQKQIDGRYLSKGVGKKYRLTLDTKEDLALFREIEMLWKGKPLSIRSKDILTLLKKYPAVAKINQQVQQVKVTS